MQFWLWLLQRVSGLLLLVLLTAHLILTHFITPAETIQVATVQGRFASMTLVLFLDYSLLFLALFHGLYGMYVVIRDLIPEVISPKALACCLVVVGVGFGILGVYTLSAFLVV